MPGRFIPRCVATVQVVFEDFGGDASRPLALDLVPLSAKVHSNGPNEADTFEIEFDGNQLPMNPDLFRAAAVDIYMYQVERVDEVRDPSTEARRPEDLAIAGLVDEASFVAGSDGRRFRMSGRDYTCLLLDTPWPDGQRFPIGRPIDEVVQELVDTVTQRKSSSFTLVVDFIDAIDPPTVKAAPLAATTGKVRVSKKGKVTVPKAGEGHGTAAKRGHSVKAGSSYWDVITRQCEHLGLIAYVRDRSIIISRPHVLVEAQDLLRHPDAGLVETHPYKFMWGRNLTEFEATRHMGGPATVPTVVVRGYDPKTQTIVEGRWPATEADRRAEAVTGIATSKSEVLNEEFPGLVDAAVATQIAKMRYHSIARTESRIKFATADLKDLDGQNLLPMRAMDAAKVGFDAFHRDDLLSLPESERVPRLRALGYRREIAELVAQNLEKIHQFERPFYVLEVTAAWDVDEGIALDGEAINFVDGERSDIR